MTSRRKSDRARYRAENRYRLRHYTFSNSRLASAHVNALIIGFCNKGASCEEQQAKRQQPQTKNRQETKEAANDQQQCNDEANRERGRLTQHLINCETLVGTRRSIIAKYLFS
jgi:hypothetical protein